MELDRRRWHRTADRKEFCDRLTRRPLAEHYRLFRNRLSLSPYPPEAFMKQIEFIVAGPPEEVVRCTETERPEALGPNDVLVRILAFPINPADLLTMQGIYPRLDSATRVVGNEAVGEIAAIGENVQDLAAGERVILLSPNNWREYRLVNAYE